MLPWWWYCCHRPVLVAEVAACADLEWGVGAARVGVGAGLAAGEQRVVVAEVLDDVAERHLQSDQTVEDPVIELRDRVAAAQDAAERIVQLGERGPWPTPGAAQRGHAG
jgi:hypothetical protein